MNYSIDPSFFRNLAGTWELRTLAAELAVRTEVAALGAGPAAHTEVAALGAEPAVRTGVAASEAGAVVRTGVAASEPAGHRPALADSSAMLHRQRADHTLVQVGS